MMRSPGRPSYGITLVLILVILWSVLLGVRAAVERWTRPQAHIVSSAPPA